ncbi:MAG TPA: universal stress protein [Bacteroidales bacterium]|nr:universal stress protein [Bacteroidales bacterium]
MPTKKVKPSDILLVPVDFGDYYEKAIEFAQKLIPITKSQIHLLHVLDLKDWWLNEVKEERLINEAFNKLLKISQQFGLPEDTKLIVLTGKRYHKIVEYADQENVRFILMVDNYPFAQGGKRIGSTLENVIMKATKPVITVKTVPKTIFKNLLTPLDLTKNCRIKLFNSVAIALKFDSTLNIVSVIFGDIDPEKSRINEKIDKYAAVYAENHIPHTKKLIRKDDDLAYQEILEYADEIKCDSIIIMTHKESASFDNYIGAFAHHIINEAKIPVISLNNASSSQTTRDLLTSIIDPLNIF